MKKSRFIRRKKFSRKTRYESAITAPYARYPELKQVDAASTAVQITSATTPILLNSIAVGTDGHQRIGRSVSLKGVQIKTYIGHTGTVADIEALRFAVVYDRSPNAGTPTFADIFTNVTNVAAVTSDSFAFPNQGNKERFKILADWNLPMTFVASATIPAPKACMDPNLPLFINRYISLKGLETKFALASSVPQTGGVYLVMQGIYAGAANPFFAITSARLTYTDV